MHSLKDLPTGADPGLVLAAVPPRDDPRDALACLERRQAGRPAAGSEDRHRLAAPRRAAAAAPGPTSGRSRSAAARGPASAKVEAGEVDAVVLAYAGLARIGRLDVVSQVFEPDEMLPAPGQGALAVECTAGRPDLADLIGLIDDGASRAATTAERAVLAALQAGCSAPVGAYAAGTDALRLDAIVVAADGGGALRASAAARRRRPSDLAARWPPICSAAAPEGIRTCPQDTSVTGTMRSELHAGQRYGRHGRAARARRVRQGGRACGCQDRPGGHGWRRSGRRGPADRSRGQAARRGRPRGGGALGQRADRAPAARPMPP